MSAPLRKIAGLVLVALVVATVLFWLRHINRGLRRQAAELPRQLERNERLRTENTRVKHVLDALSVRGTNPSAEQPLREEIDRLRIEKAELEKQAEQRRVKRAVAEETLATNRDPQSGPMRMEYFQNARRATPLAAFQTFVWAASSGDDQTVATMIAFRGQARDNAMALISTLPQDQQAKFPTPEALAALAFANLITGHLSAQVLGQTTIDPNHAEVTVAFNGRKNGEPLPMQQSESGWKMVVTEQHLTEIQKHLNGVSAVQKIP